MQLFRFSAFRLPPSAHVEDNTGRVHGRILTKSISFRDTIKVIGKYAFYESPYPSILSFEVHCGADQQGEIVKTMIEEFGEKLVLQPRDWESTIPPPPKVLKYRILIKVKAAAEELDTKTLASEISNRGRERRFSSRWLKPVQLNDNVIPNSLLISNPPSMGPPKCGATFCASPRTSTTCTNNTTPTSAEESDSPHVTAAEDKDKKKSKKSKSNNIAKILGDLGVYTRGFRFTGFEAYEAYTFNHVFSFNERMFDRLTKAGARDKQLLEEHNMRYLMRVYPGGHRINSSNKEAATRS